MPKSAFSTPLLMVLNLVFLLFVSLFSVLFQATKPSRCRFQCVALKANGKERYKGDIPHYCFEIQVLYSTECPYRRSVCSVTVRAAALQKLLKINSSCFVLFTNLLDCLSKVLGYVQVYCLITHYSRETSPLTALQTRLVGLTLQKPLQPTCEN
jgi:hypothetical protein